MNLQEIFCIQNIMYLKASTDVKISTFLWKMLEWTCGSRNGPLKWELLSVKCLDLDLLSHEVDCICEVIKQNESYVGNIDFEIHPTIVWNSFCILLFSAGQNCLYLLNRKSDFDKVFSKTKLSITKLTTNLKFDSAQHKTRFAWSHHIFQKSNHTTCMLCPHSIYYMRV